MRMILIWSTFYNQSNSIEGKTMSDNIPPVTPPNSMTDEEIATVKADPQYAAFKTIVGIEFDERIANLRTEHQTETDSKSTELGFFDWIRKAAGGA